MITGGRNKLGEGGTYRSPSGVVDALVPCAALNVRRGRGRRATHALALAGLIVCLLVGIAGAEASDDRVPPPTFTEPAPGASAPQLGTDPFGRVPVAVWQRFDGTRYLVEAVRLEPTTGAVVMEPFAVSKEDATSPQVAVEPDGRATIVWQRFDGADQRIEAVRLGADGSVGPVQVLSEASEDATSPQVAVDPDGRATIVWQRFDGADQRIEGVRIGADGGVGPVQVLSEAGEDAIAPQVVAHSGGHATVAWRTGGAGAVKALRLGPSGPGDLVHILTDAAGALGPVVIGATNDSTIVAWQPVETTPHHIDARVLDYAGRPGGLRSLSTSDEMAG